MKILEQAFEAVRTFKPVSAAEREILPAKTASPASRGKWEPFKTSPLFDSIAQNPAWLGQEPPARARSYVIRKRLSNDTAAWMDSLTCQPEYRRDSRAHRTAHP